ncbi:hypothetical protein [Streptomyces lavendulocolor]|uniref:hypothetical protein n=1 Tax=Streptomyces lavendulocolor TaxID=67316 RepID=UPI003C2D8DE5
MSREQLSDIAHADHPIKSPAADESVGALLERALATRPRLHAEGIDVSRVARTGARRAASELGVEERLVIRTRKPRTSP